MTTYFEEPPRAPYVYIGDGVYALVEGSTVTLKTQRGPTWQTIVLEPEVWGSLCILAMQQNGEANG
ncbi:MAG: hypothetical protein NTW69_13615 [Chloroflexi bacterium]|nr:hypothetical protein [Chloroflexota bacterium]